MSFDKLAEKTARYLGSRVTRRSFIGRTAVALAVVGAGGIAFEPSPALASDCPCKVCGDSTSCGGSYHHPCPMGTCAGGAWYVCTSICSGKSYTKFQDCITTSDCHIYCGRDHRPGCYYTTPYGACGGRTTVWCRSVTCTSSGSC
jgi:hypothetical protein